MKFSKAFICIITGLCMMFSILAGPAGMSITAFAGEDEMIEENTDVFFEVPSYEEYEEQEVIPDIVEYYEDIYVPEYESISETVTEPYSEYVPYEQDIPDAGIEAEEEPWYEEVIIPEETSASETGFDEELSEGEEPDVYEEPVYDYGYPDDDAELEIMDIEIEEDETLIVETTKSFDGESYDYSSAFPASSDSLLMSYFDNLLFGSQKRLTTRTVSLEGNDLILYNALYTMIKEVASGSRASTSFEVPLSAFGVSQSYTEEELHLSGPVYNISADDYNEDILNEAYNKIFAMFDADIDLVDSKLMADMPYDLYWWNKSVDPSDTQISVSTSISGNTSTTVFYLDCVSVFYDFEVAPEYRGNSDYTVDTDKTYAASAAAENALTIVNNAVGLSVSDKLAFFKQSICDLTSYNYNAADAGGSFEYGSMSPWQVIWVFDNAPDTTVVCEGYSKAFKYLCDLSGDITCITVIGYMDEGPHMWNIVNLDGVNYFVDVTNCDSDTIGFPDLLFMKSDLTGSYDTAYYAEANGTTIEYVYDDSTFALYSPSELIIGYVGVDLAILQQPENVTAVAGDTVYFSVAAEGEGLTYQWQFRKNSNISWGNTSMTGAATDTITVPVTATRNGYQYRCIVSDNKGNSITSDSATLTVRKELQITKQPEDVTAAAGDTVYFSVTASGDGLTYKWQFKKPGGSWGNTSMAGAATNKITVPVTEARNGYQYRCIVTDANGNSITSDIAKLTVGTAFRITEQPEDVTAPAGDTVYFSITAEGEGLTYQWQFRKNSNISWANTSMAGATTDTLTVPVTTARNGYQYRCIVTDANGNSITSDIAKLTVGTAFRITEQPEDVTAPAGATVYFSIAAEGEGLTYQWQFRKNSNISWGNTSMTGAKTDTLTVPVTDARNGYQYRCIVTDANGNSITSDIAKLTVGTAFRIAEQPEDVTAPAGATVYFSITAEGEGLTYQWQFRKNSNISWANTSMAGATTYTLTVPVTTARNGYQYRCIVTDANGDSITSDIAKLTVGAVFMITEQPEDVTAPAGDTVYFSIAAEGEGLTYQWQFRKNSNISWANTSMAGATTDTLTVPVTTARNGYQYRCIVTDANGDSITSDIAKLTVGVILRITAQPEDVTAIAGDTVYFSVTAEGEDLTYQWQFRKNSNISWGNTSMTGAKTDTITVPVTDARNGYQYRCVVTDKNGDSITSDEAILTVYFGDLVYEAIDETTVRVRLYRGTDSSVTVPETYNGMTVTEIGEGAFENNTTLVSIDLPDTIQIIRTRAFAGCTNLAQMN